MGVEPARGCVRRDLSRVSDVRPSRSRPHAALTTVMLAFAFIPSIARIARADGPIIDADVQRLMDEKPDEEHALIVSVELCRTPLNLEELLPTPEETNECTRRWRGWETLAEEFEEGCNENLTKEHVDAAYAEAKAYDDVIVAIQKAAYKACHEDYATIVAESVPDVYETLRSVLGDKVRRVSESSKLLGVRANRAAFETIREISSIKRVSYDFETVPMLDVSRVNIEADRVHNGEGGVGPYTGDGVKVAIVDDGIDYAHPRLPSATSCNEEDFSTENESCKDPGNNCTYGHGTAVAGVAFTQPDEEDDYVGIAYNATLVNAKIGTSFQICDEGCPPSGCQGEYGGNNWTVTMAAFEWAVVPHPPATCPLADVINYSRGAGLFPNQEDTDTNQDHVSALNVDWIVYTSGARFVHSCGNHGEPDQEHLGTLGVPSGAYNLVSVGAYDDVDSVDREDALLADFSSWGWTDDYRRKPDLCAPGANVFTTDAHWDYEGGCGNFGLFTEHSGTSFAAPHVAGVVGLLLEARPSLTPSQVHAVLINSYTQMDSVQQSDWHRQAGWGMLHAHKAVKQRNYIVSGTLDDDDDSEVFYLGTVPAGEKVVITGVWHRAMSDEDSPVEDGNSNPSPANLDLILESKDGSAEWETEVSTIDTYGVDDGFPEDNARQVRARQNDSGQTQLQFRVRVEHNPTTDNPYAGAQAFSLASRHGFTQ
ncbi:MAG: S8 family peptidase [Phycisphaerales bacterium]|nr:S8 family peptidase [Phycisphaerales bacterium]